MSSKRSRKRKRVVVDDVDTPPRKRLRRVSKPKSPKVDSPSYNDDKSLLSDWSPPSSPASSPSLSPPSSPRVLEEGEVSRDFSEVASGPNSSIADGLASDLSDEYDPMSSLKRRLKKYKDLEEKFLDIQKELRIEDPDIIKILTTSMTRKEQKDMVQLGGVYDSLPDDSLEKFHMRKQLLNDLDHLSKTDSAQREYIDQEETRLLSRGTDPMYELKIKILDLLAPEAEKVCMFRLLKDMQDYPKDNSMYASIKIKLEFMISLPYQKVSIPIMPRDSSSEAINFYCIEIKKRLDSKLYGMEKVKQSLLAYCVKRITNPSSKCSIGLKGKAGVGKTAIFGALASAINIPFASVSLGGMVDSSPLRGTDNVWVGSSASIILQHMKSMQVSDGMILFDEIDKISTDSTGGSAVQNALLHIVDYTQNSKFRDQYVNDFPHDLSRIWFVYALNDENTIHPILRNRLHIIELEPYTDRDYIEIIKRHLLPKALVDSGIESSLCTIDNSGCLAILDRVRDRIMETGVRPIEHLVEDLVLKINMQRSITLKDGTTGPIKMAGEIPDFHLPLTIMDTTIKHLLGPAIRKTPSYIS